MVADQGVIGATVGHGRSRSMASPSSRSTCSWKCLPTICRPTGRPSTRPAGTEIAGTPVGLSVCEDAWHEGAPFDGYAASRPPVIVNLNASPYHRGKTAEREAIAAERARQTGSWIVYVNAVGGQDELVFDGGSFVVDPRGVVRHRAAAFEEDILLVEIDGATSHADPRDPWPDDLGGVYRALLLEIGRAHV